MRHPALEVLESFSDLTSVIPDQSMDLRVCSRLPFMVTIAMVRPWLKRVMLGVSFLREINKMRLPVGFPFQPQNTRGPSKRKAQLAFGAPYQQW